MNWSGKKILVTGAGGFIGSHLTERLIKKGAQVRAFVRYTGRGEIGMLQALKPDDLSKIELIRGDLRDVEAVRAAVKDMDIVFHLGALIAIPYSYVHPREVIETNVIGTLNILMAAKEFSTPKIIHTSTSEVYGTAQYTPIDENHPLQGQSPYSASKIGADKIAQSFALSYDLPVVTLRPFNTYGPRQSMRAVIPSIIVQTLTRDQIKLGSLDPIRDFTYVSDTVEGFLLAAEANEVIGKDIHLGTGEAVSIGDLVTKISTIIGKSPKIICDSQRLRPPKSEVMNLIASNKKAKELLGWSPQISLDVGLQSTIEWLSKHLDLYSKDQYTL
jgi:dTDP-glucose 4,6-dehydratase